MEGIQLVPHTKAHQIQRSRKQEQRIHGSFSNPFFGDIISCLPIVLKALTNTKLRKIVYLHNIHFSKNTFSDKASVQEFLFRKLPHNLIIHINIFARLDLHYLQQGLCSYRMERPTRNAHGLSLTNSKLVAIKFHPAAPLNHRPCFITPLMQVIGQRTSRTKRNFDRKALRFRVNDMELAP